MIAANNPTAARKVNRLSPAFRAGLAAEVEIDAERDLFAVVETGRRGAKHVIGAGAFDEMKSLADIVCCHTGHTCEVVAVESVKLATA